MSSRATMPKGAKPAAPVAVPSVPAAAAAPTVTHDQIAMRAYEKWRRRGEPCDGTQQSDWLAAEAELLAECRKTKR